MKVLCVLPARIASQRIPRKPLRELAGRSLLEWSWRAARRVSSFDEVWVATDADEVAEAARSFGAEAVLTRSDHGSGTDRVAEAAARPRARGFDTVVNYQADEPFLDADAVDRAVRVVAEGAAGMATLAAPVASLEEWRSESTVKVVRDGRGDALYFSRAPIPHPRGREPLLEEGDAAAYLRHAGLYVFRRRVLEGWSELPASGLEEVEKLEQLRALEAGVQIRVVVGPRTPPGVDVPEDLERAERILSEEGRTERGEVNV